MRLTKFSAFGNEPFRRDSDHQMHVCAIKQGTPPRTWWWDQKTEDPTRHDYSREGEAAAPPQVAPLARLAPQARPTIAEGERPREAMSQVDADAERQWTTAHTQE